MNFLILLIKQSLKDFKSKWVLYSIFAFFLSIVISLVLGLSSFSLNFKNDISQVMGQDNTNLQFNKFNYRSYDDENIDSWFYSDISKWNIITNNNDQSFYNFTKNLISEVWNQDIEYFENEYLSFDQFIIDNQGFNFINLFLDITGSKLGDIFLLTTENIQNNIGLKNQYINQQLTTENIDKYNLVANKILDVQYAWDQNQNYKTSFKFITSNLLNAFVFEKIIQNPQNKFRPNLYEHHSKEEIKFSWLSSENLLEWKTNKVPKIFKDYLFWNNFKIYQQLEIDKLNKQQNELYQNGDYLFYTPKSLKTNNCQVGDIVSILIDNRYQKFLVLGVANTVETTLESNTRTHIILPFVKFCSIVNYQNLITTNGNLMVYLKDYSNPNQDFKNKIISPYFSNKNSYIYVPSGIYLRENEIIQTLNLYIMLDLVLNAFSLGLLLVVFYFITYQIILLQKKTLFFLKSMGLNNFYLTFLSTSTIIVPTLIGNLFGLMGGIFVQDMMFKTTGSLFSFTHSFFTFTNSFWLVLLIISLFVFISFFIINFLIIKSKTLKFEQINFVKSPSSFFIFLKLKILYKLPSKNKIGVSFFYKNIYKSILSTIILSLSFGVILFTIQFNASIKYTSTAYEKWNTETKNYTAVKYATNLKPFINSTVFDLENNDLIYSYDTISLDKQSDLYKFINKIDSFNELNKLIKNSETNWNQQYLSSNLTKLFFTDYGQKIIHDLIDKISNPELQTRIHNIFNELATNYQKLKLDYGYNGGFNIFFGNCVLQNENNLSVQSLDLINTYSQEENIKLLLFNQEDIESSNHFRFNENYQIYFNQSLQKLIIDVNVSQKFALENNLSLKDVFSGYVPNLIDYHESNSINKKPTINFRIKNIITENNLFPEIYISKQLFYGYKKQYYENLQLNNSNSTIDFQNYINKYQQIIDDLSINPFLFDNSVYSFEKLPQIPYSLKNIVLPIIKTNDLSNPGSKLLDYYDSDFKYYQNIESNVYIFPLITKELLIKAKPTKELMDKFIILLSILTLSISLILTILILFENKEIILLFKASGYRIFEVNWYLISGYIFAALIADIVGSFLAFFGIKILSNSFYYTLNTNLIFVWNSVWFFVLILLLFAFFVSIVYFSSSKYTKTRHKFDLFNAS